jgi:hypothetical protein
MALDPSIALGVRPLQLPDPLAQMAQVSQIQASQRQNEMAQMQLEQLKQDRLEMKDFQSQLEKSGGNPDLDLLAKTMLKSPKYFQQGVELTQKLKEQKEYQAYLDRQAKPAGITMPTGATMAAPTGAAAPMNALAASAGVSPQPSVNALAAPQSRLDELQARFREVSRFTAPGAKAEADMLKDQIKALQAVHVVPNVGLVSGAGQTIVASGMAPTEIKKLTSERDSLPAGDPRRKVYDQAIADLGAANRNAEARLKFDQNKFAWEKANPGFELKEAEDGSIVGVNKRTLQAFPVTVGGAAPAATPTVQTGMPGARLPAPVSQAIPGMTSVLDQQAPAAAPAAGTPLRGKGTALTETQSNATAFGMRMKEANSILTTLEQAGVKNTGLISGVTGSIVGVVPLIGDKLTGMTESVFNVLPRIMGGLSPEQQQVAQARLNFITANLRKESGATLLPSEFITEEKKYFPKPGDDATVIAQKQKARNLALKAMEIQAGPGAKNIQQYQTGVAGGSGDGGGGIPNATATNPLGLVIPGVR